MRKPNILFISYAFYPLVGGVEVNADILTGYFHQKGYPIKVLTSVKATGEKKFPFDVVRNPGIRELMKLHRWADVVYQNNPSLRLSWPILFSSSTSIITINGRVSRDDGRLGIQDKLKILLLKKADGVIAVSGAMRDKFFPAATAIGNPYRHELFKNLNLHRPSLSFVFLGRLVSEKGVHIAIKAFKNFSEANLIPDIKPTLKIIGDGPEWARLNEMVQRYDLENQISFEGRKEGSELVKILNSCQYILVPSFNEGFGNVVLEGMACGCLPFVSDCGGLPEAIGDAGIKFKTFSVKDLESAIIKIISNPDLERAYRSKMEGHLAKHKPDYVAEKYLRIIEGAYSKKNIVG